MFANYKCVLDIVKYKWIYLIISLVIMIGSVGIMGYSIYKNHTPVLVGIDFTGGTIAQFQTEQNIGSEQVAMIREKLVNEGIENPIIQVLRTTSISQEEKANGDVVSIKTAFAGDKGDTSVQKIESIITSMYLEAQLAQVNSIGPTLGAELLKNSVIAILLAMLGICAYLTLRFHLEFALIALLTLVHDVLFVVGVFSFLGLFYGVHIDSLFITAALTVLGFSVHDTIVVFDRIRENTKYSSKSTTYNEIVNASVNQTLARSINTSFTTLITLLALYFFGGVTTKDFVFAMILGIAVGTYSSIFFASVLLVFFNDNKSKQKAA